MEPRVSWLLKPFGQPFQARAVIALNHNKRQLGKANHGGNGDKQRQFFRRMIEKETGEKRQKPEHGNGEVNELRLAGVHDKSVQIFQSEFAVQAALVKILIVLGQRVFPAGQADGAVKGGLPRFFPIQQQRGGENPRLHFVR